MNASNVIDHIIGLIHAADAGVDNDALLVEIEEVINEFRGDAA